jgi:hypothetical protein
MLGNMNGLMLTSYSNLTALDISENKSAFDLLNRGYDPGEMT